MRYFYENCSRANILIDRHIQDDFLFSFLIELNVEGQLVVDIYDMPRNTFFD